MQKMLRTIWALCFTVLAYSAVAQDMPLDKEVRTGKLQNGLTYYIRKNAKPEKRVELRLVVNAGSLMEDDNQLGLAHFTEHMCFNGTKNFPKNKLVDYLQSIGVRFGADLNAYTSFDETVYMLPIPSDKEELVDQGFQILEDWAHNVTFDGVEIDKERGVVIEEWRTGQGAERRMLDKWLPLLMKNSRYADRLPIGTKASLETFSHEVVRKFYKDWYRPDLMAVVVVGDIDVDKMEGKVKTYFNRLEPTKNPRERKNYDVPVHKETFVKVLQDKEAPFNTLRLYYKQPNEVLRNKADYRNNLMYELYQTMLSERLDEIAQKPETPFIFAYSGYDGMWARGSKAYQVFAQVGDETMEQALKTLLTENKRVLDYGFQASELERAKQELFKRYEKNYNERSKTNSDVFVDEYIRYFLEGTPAPGIEFEYNLVKEYLPAIKIEEINILPKKWITKENRVVIITAPDKPAVKLPTEARVLEIINEIDNIKTTAYEDKVINEPLMASLPTAGKIVKETKLPKIEDVKEFMLSNGVRVVCKKTTFKDDEIRISAYSQGGVSLCAESDIYSANYASQIVGEMGVGKFSDSDLKKLLSGKNVRVSSVIDDYYEGITGSTSPKDMELMFQLLHLRFTSPRKDESAFQAHINKYKALYKNLGSNPQFYMLIELDKLMSNNHPRHIGFPTAESLDKVNLDRVLQIYKERFADAKDFVFTIVGNYDEAVLKTMLEKYVASLPTKATAKPETFKDHGIRPPSGNVNKEFKSGQDPKSIVSLAYTGEAKGKDAFAIIAFGDVLENKLIENLREDKGGVYSPQTGANVTKIPYNQYEITVRFSCAPENVAKLVNAVYEEIEKIQKNGPLEADLQKIKESYRRELEKNSQDNGFWMSRIQKIYKHKEAPKSLEESRKRIEALTGKEIQAVAQKYAVKNNLISATLYPEKVIEPEKKEGETKEEAQAEGTGANKDMTAEKVIDNYIKAIGGKEKLMAVNALRQQSTSEVMGMEVKATVSRKGTDKMHMLQTLPMGQGEAIIIINGDKGIAKSPMGKEEMSKEDLAKRKRGALFPELDFVKNGVKLELLPAEKVNGKLAYPVKNTQESKITTTWYDAQTGLTLKVLSEDYEATVNEYAEVNGIKFPAKQTMKLLKQGGMEMTMKITTEVNPTLSDDLFKVE